MVITNEALYLCCMLNWITVLIYHPENRASKPRDPPIRKKASYLRTENSLLDSSTPLDILGPID